MSKQSGLGHGVIYDDDADLSSDIGAAGRISTAVAQLDITGIDKEAFERLNGLASGGIDVMSFFNPAAGRSHSTFSQLPRADRLLTYRAGSGRGAPAACVLGKQLQYDPTRANDGALTADVTVDSNGFGLEWGQLLTNNVETVGAAGALAGVDTEYPVAEQLFGLQAYLHVLAFTGTSALITIEDSNDNGVDPWAAVPGAVFTSVTAAGVERIQTSRTAGVKQWLRLNVTGTFSDLQFAVVAVRNHAVTSF